MTDEDNVLELIFNDKQWVANIIREPSTKKGVALMINEEDNFMVTCFGEFSKFELVGIFQTLAHTTLHGEL